MWTWLLNLVTEIWDLLFTNEDYSKSRVMVKKVCNANNSYDSGITFNNDEH